MIFINNVRVTAKDPRDEKDTVINFWNDKQNHMRNMVVVLKKDIWSVDTYTPPQYEAHT